MDALTGESQPPEVQLPETQSPEPLYPHLHPETVALLDCDDETRIHHASKAEFIEHSRAAQILAALDRLYRQPLQDRMDGLLIAGPTFCGKTSLARYFESNHPRDANLGGDHVIQPVAYTLAPDEPNVTRLIELILKAMGGAHLSNEKPETVRERMLTSAAACGLKVLLLDEIHGILNGTPKKQRLLMTTLKNLSNEMKINIVLLGTREAFIATMGAEELQTRFPVEWLPAWQQDDAEFKGLLRGFERQLPLRRPSNLKDFSARLYTLCSGSLGWLSRLLTRAAEVAISTGEERITSQVLDRVVLEGWLSPDRRDELRRQALGLEGPDAAGSVPA